MSTLDLSEYIRVVNRTESKIRGRFDGKDYEFKVNDPTDVHQSVAAHIFGFGVEDKTNAFHRLGWLVKGDYEEALSRLDKIEFDQKTVTTIERRISNLRGVVGPQDWYMKEFSRETMAYFKNN